MDLTGLALRLMELLGGPGTALVIAAEAVFPPVPGEVLLPFAGVSAAAEGRSVLWPLGWTTLGSVLGGLLVYGAGRSLGARRTTALVRRIPLAEEADVDRAIAFFARHGFPAVALARFVPMVRSAISVPAGIERMPVGLFALATGLGSGIWNAVFVVTGYLFGTAGGEALEGFVRGYSLLVAVVGAGAVLVIARRRLRARARARAGTEDGGPSRPSAADPTLEG